VIVLVQRRGGHRGTGAAMPPLCLVHLVLAGAQIGFGGGAILGKFGLRGTNPVLFALLREGVAGPVLWAAAGWRTRVALPPAADVPRLLAAGAALFVNQLFFILGLKVSDPVSGSAWQPTQPIFTMAIAVCCGYERATWRRTFGTVLAVSGAVFMVVCGAGGIAADKATAWAGQLLFFFKCMGTSSYVVLTKDLVARHSPLSVTAWSYMVGSSMLLVVACCFNSVPALLGFVCDDPDREARDACVDNAWRIPITAVGPLCYWIAVSSVFAYAAMTWANRYVRSSVVSVYTVLQPATSALVSYALLVVRGPAWGAKYDLHKPGLQDLGLVGIVLGLVVVLGAPAAPQSGAAACAVSPAAAPGGGPGAAAGAGCGAGAGGEGGELGRKEALLQDQPAEPPSARGAPQGAPLGTAQCGA